MNNNITIRATLKKDDYSAIKNILESSGFFYDYEIKIALEIVDEYMQKGEEQSGYYFLIAESNNKPVGFTCFGEIPCTKNSFDLYWIAVDFAIRGAGIGKILLAETEKKIKEKSGKRIYIETSSREIYTPTRAFYIKCGYTESARLKNFYDINDDKIIYEKQK